jgi:insulysin
LPDITSADVQAFAKELFQRMYIEALIHGNVDAEGAAKLQNTIETILKPRALTEAERAGSRSLIVPPGSSLIHSIPHPNPAEVNNAVVYHLYLGDVTDFALRAALQLFEQIANEPAFDQLRTKEQLGYIVQTSVTMRTGELGWKVLIQSERDPVHVESRIENFIGNMTGILDKMTGEEFAKNRQSLISKREEKAKNLGEETRKYWNRVTDQYYEFGRREFRYLHHA